MMGESKALMKALASTGCQIVEQEEHTHLKFTLKSRDTSPKQTYNLGGISIGWAGLFLTEAPELRSSPGRVAHVHTRNIRKCRHQCGMN